MTLLYAILLGLIQGLTEFIPISSTAHLTIAGKIFGVIDPNHPEHWTSFMAVIQMGTLIAVLIFFKKELISIPKSFLKENLSTKREPINKQSFDSRMGWYIILGTLPIITIGLALKKVIEGSLTKDLNIIAYSLILLAIVLAIAEKNAKFTKSMTSIKLKDAITVGFAQCLALFPGASRSGSTIMAGLFLGIDRESAARFSFLLSIPAIFASGMLSFLQALKYINSSDLLNLIVATIVAGISGYYSIAFLLNYLKTKSTFLFIWYRIILGLLILTYIHLL